MKEGLIYSTLFGFVHFPLNAHDFAESGGRAGRDTGSRQQNQCKITQTQPAKKRKKENQCTEDTKHPKHDNVLDDSKPTGRSHIMCRDTNGPWHRQTLGTMFMVNTKWRKVEARSPATRSEARCWEVSHAGTGYNHVPYAIGNEEGVGLDCTPQDA